VSTNSRRQRSNASRQLLQAGAIALCLFGGAACQSHEALQPQTETANSSTSTSRVSLTDAQTGRAYDVFIYDPSPDSAASKAVIYMTDANANFWTMAQSLTDQRKANPRFSVGALVVGIGYADDINVTQARGLDLTNAPSDIELPDGFGGDAAFRRFVTEDVKSWVAANHAVDPARETLFGHSFGGLFAVRTLIEAPDAFDTYVAASTSLWWGEKSLLRQELAALGNFAGDQSRPRVLLTVGELEEVRTPAAAPAKPKSDGPPPLPGFVDRAQVSDAKELARRLNDEHGIPTELIIIEGEGHMSVLPAAISSTITFALSEE